VRYRWRTAVYEIEVVQRADAPFGLTVDGTAVAGNAVPLADDGRTHAVVLVLAPGMGAASVVAAAPAADGALA